MSGVESGRAAALVVAPLARELSPLVERIGGRRVGSLPHGSLYAGRWQGRDVSAAVLGDGHGRFNAGLEALMATGIPERVLLVGVAGGLSPELGVGEIVRAGRVVDGISGVDWSPPSPGDGTVVTAEWIVGPAAEKESLWKLQGEPSRAVVDLETSHFARWAAETMPAVGRALDWTVLRAVSDPQGDDLPLDFAAASDAAGHVVGRLVARLLAKRPGAVGGLAELHRRLGLCAERLAGAALEWVGEGDA